MKGTIGDLRRAEDLASKGRYADAIKIMDRILGIPADADENAVLQALKASLESTARIDDTLRSEMEARTSLNVTRFRLTADLVSVCSLLEKRMLWLINRVVVEQSEEALLAACNGAYDIIGLLRDHSAAARIALDDQANLLMIAISFWFVMNYYDEQPQILLEAAVRRAPANAKLRAFILQSFSINQANLRKDTPSAVAKRKYYQAMVDLLTNFVDIVNTAAEIVDQRASIPFSDVPGAGFALAPKNVLEMVIKRMADKMKSENDPARAEQWAESVALARRILRRPTLHISPPPLLRPTPRLLHLRR